MFIQAVKRHLKAKTEKGIERAMLLNNLKHGTWFNYGDPIWTGSEWVVWYLKEENAFDAVKNEVKNVNE